MLREFAGHRRWHWRPVQPARHRPPHGHRPRACAGARLRSADLRSNSASSGARKASHSFCSSLRSKGTSWAKVCHWCCKDLIASTENTPPSCKDFASEINASRRAMLSFCLAFKGASAAWMASSKRFAARQTVFLQCDHHRASVGQIDAGAGCFFPVRGGRLGGCTGLTSSIKAWRLALFSTIGTGLCPATAGLAGALGCRLRQIFSTSHGWVQRLGQFVAIGHAIGAKSLAACAQAGCLGQRNRLLNQLLAQGVGLLRLPAQAVASGQQLGVYLLGHVGREPAAMLFKALRTWAMAAACLWGGGRQGF